MQQFVMALQMSWLSTEVVRYLPSHASTGFCSAGTAPNNEKVLQEKKWGDTPYSPLTPAVHGSKAASDFL